MKIVIDVLLVVAAVSLIVGVISRAMLTPVCGVEARALLGFTLACLAFAATLGIRELARK